MTEEVYAPRITPVWGSDVRAGDMLWVRGEWGLVVTASVPYCPVDNEPREVRFEMDLLSEDSLLFRFFPAAGRVRVLRAVSATSDAPVVSFPAAMLRRGDLILPDRVVREIRTDGRGALVRWFPAAGPPACDRWTAMSDEPVRVRCFERRFS